MSRSPVEFTSRFRKAVAAAREEAIAMQCRQIEPGHLLLGLLADDKGAASSVLSRIGVDSDRMREHMRTALRPHEPVTIEPVHSHSDNAKRALELAMSASRDLGHEHIGTEHLLLALLRLSDTVAARELALAGVTFERAQHEIAEVIATSDSRLDELIETQRGEASP